MLIYIALLVIPSASWSAQKTLCLDPAIAERLYVDLQHARSDAAAKGKKLGLCTESEALAERLVENQEAKIKALTSDKEAYRREAERMNELYQKADRGRVAAENAAPSRLRWFSAGVVATLAAIAGAFAATR